jgi:flavin reductase (DIM6/NTAB) family NADH-FMN oxidoreductase RutF
MITSIVETFVIMTFDPEQLRAAMRAWTTGITIVAASYNGDRHGMTVSSFTSISLDPALITISLQGPSRTCELVTQSGAFGLTILSAEQQELSELFAGRMPDIIDRFAGLETESMVTGSPLIKGGLAWLDCRVVYRYDAGMNALFIGEVVAAQGGGDGTPLIYHDRQYRQLK